MNLSVAALRRIANNTGGLSGTLIQPLEKINAQVSKVENLPEKISKWQPLGRPPIVVSKKTGNLILLKKLQETGVNSGNYELHILDRLRDGIFNLFAFETPWNLTDNPLPTSKSKNWVRVADEFYSAISDPQFYGNSNWRTFHNLGYIFNHSERIKILDGREFPHDQREIAISEMLENIFTSVAFQSLTSDLIFKPDQSQDNHLKLSLMHVRRSPAGLEIISANSRHRDELTEPQPLKLNQFRSLQLTQIPDGLSYGNYLRTYECVDSTEANQNSSVFKKLSKHRLDQYLDDVILGSGISTGKMNFSTDSNIRIESITPESDYSFMDRPQSVHSDERYALFELLRQQMAAKNCPPEFLSLSRMESNLKYWSFILGDFLGALKVNRV
jgi:hypothetical protein